MTRLEKHHTEKRKNAKKFLSKMEEGHELPMV
jgi:hypothetical protein